MSRAWNTHMMYHPSSDVFGGAIRAKSHVKSACPMHVRMAALHERSIMHAVCCCRWLVRSWICVHGAYVNVHLIRQICQYNYINCGVDVYTSWSTHSYKYRRKINVFEIFAYDDTKSTGDFFDMTWCFCFLIHMACDWLIESNN